MGSGGEILLGRFARYSTTWIASECTAIPAFTSNQTRPLLRMHARQVPGESVDFTAQFSQKRQSPWRLRELRCKSSETHLAKSV